MVDICHYFSPLLHRVILQLDSDVRPVHDGDAVLVAHRSARFTARPVTKKPDYVAIVYQTRIPLKGRFLSRNLLGFGRQIKMRV